MYRVNRLILDLDMMPADLGVMAPLLLSTFAETDFRGVDKVDVVVAVAVCCCCCCCMLLPLFFSRSDGHFTPQSDSSDSSVWRLVNCFSLPAFVNKHSLTGRTGSGIVARLTEPFGVFFYFCVEVWQQMPIQRRRGCREQQFTRGFSKVVETNRWF